MTKLSELDAMLTFGADDILAATEDASGNSKSVAGSVLRAYMQDADVTAATRDATANTLMKRDQDGRARVVAPHSVTDIALKSTVTTDIATHDALATAHGVIAGSDAANGDFTSGTVYWQKIGNMVTVAWSTLAHGSDAEPDSLAAFIPAAYRPAAIVHNVCSFNVLVLSQVIIKTDGQFSISYCDWTGAATVRTGTIAGSVSYVVV